MFDPRSQYYRKNTAEIENKLWQDYKSGKERMGEIYRGAPKIAAQAKENAIKRNEPSDLNIKKYKDISNSSFKDIDKKIDEYIKLNEKENFLARIKEKSRENNQLENKNYQETVKNRTEILREEKKALEKYWKENLEELNNLSEQQFGFSSSIADKQKEEIARISKMYDNDIGKARSIVMGPKYNEKKEEVEVDNDFKNMKIFQGANLSKNNKKVSYAKIDDKQIQEFRMGQIQQKQKEASEVIIKNSTALNERIKSLGIELKPIGSEQVNDKVISNTTVAPKVPAPPPSVPKDLKKETELTSIPHFDTKKINSLNEAGYVITQMMNAQIDYLNQMKKMMENLQNQKQNVK